MKNPRITLGFSGNPGLYARCNKSEGEKGYLSNFFGKLEGSTLNFANLLKVFSFNPNILLPVAIQHSLESEIFDFLLRESELPITRLHVLGNSPLALIPNGELFGAKGIVSKDASVLVNAERQIERSDGLWRIATGVNSDLIFFTQALFRESEGYRSFSPHYSLCSQKELILPVLHFCDFIIVNEHELELLQMSTSELHNFGVSLVIVTKGEKGGIFSLCNESNSYKEELGYFDSIKPKSDRLFFVGLGDCFNASFNSKMFQSEFSFKTVTSEYVLQSCNFAAKVAAIKINKEGASNVPTLEEIENF